MPKKKAKKEPPTDYQRGANAMRHLVFLWLMDLHKFTGAQVYDALALRTLKLELPLDGEWGACADVAEQHDRQMKRMEIGDDGI